MAQTWRVAPKRQKKLRPPLDEEALERLALAYVGRYSTTRARLNIYLTRKLRERGWGGERPPGVEALVERAARLGYVDDRLFASARAASLQRRGYGQRRIDQALQAAGIAEDDAAEVREEVESVAFKAAHRFAKRRKIGPYAAGEPGREARQKAFAAMMRAGHPIEIVRRILNIPPDTIPECDSV